jgi:hypothetical protein
MDLLTTVAHELGNALGLKEVGTPGNVMAETLALGVRGLDFDSLSMRTEPEPQSVTAPTNVEPRSLGLRDVTLDGTPGQGTNRTMIDWDAEVGALLDSLSPHGRGPEKTAFKPLFPVFEPAAIEGWNSDGQRLPARSDDERTSRDWTQGGPVRASAEWEWRIEVGAAGGEVSRSEVEPTL